MTINKLIKKKLISIHRTVIYSVNTIIFHMHFHQPTSNQTDSEKFLEILKKTKDHGQ